jgi:serine/threonine protein kinase
VYRVQDEVEGEERAFKLFDSAAGYEAVRREISALRMVNHPHVVRVIWADRTSKGEWYLISEYVRGEPLDDYANGKKNLRDREAVDVALDVLDALIAIHPDAVRLDELEQKKREGELSSEEFDEMLRLQDEGLVHRDIKPQNIILTRQGAKLLDFNIASRVGDPVMTVSGTPPYQAPDVDYTRWDVSTDLFAVGVTLYELMCNGEHPYEGRRPMHDFGFPLEGLRSFSRRPVRDGGRDATGSGGRADCNRHMIDGLWEGGPESESWEGLTLWEDSKRPGCIKWRQDTLSYPARSTYVPRVFRIHSCRQTSSLRSKIKLVPTVDPPRRPI